MRLGAKGQFFIVATFIIVSILYSVSRWMEPAGLIDTSEVVTRDEVFMFNNIVEKATHTINGSKNCEDLNYALQEYKLFTESYATKKGYNLDLNYTVAPCPELYSPTTVAFNITLLSPNSFLKAEFSCGWPAGCPI